MKFVAHYAKKYILSTISSNVLYNASVVPIYGDVPSNATTPYMTVITDSQDEIDMDNDGFGYQVLTKLEVVTSFGRGTQDSSITEQIMNDALNLIRAGTNSTLDMSGDGLSNYSISMGTIQQIKEEYPDRIYVRLIADINFNIEES